MAKKQDVELLTLKALAKRLGMSYPALRKDLIGANMAEIEYQGYRFAGHAKRNWFAYDASKHNVVILDDEWKIGTKRGRPPKPQQ